MSKARIVRTNKEISKPILNDMDTINSNCAATLSGLIKNKIKRAKIKKSIPERIFTCLFIGGR